MLGTFAGPGPAADSILRRKSRENRFSCLVGCLSDTRGKRKHYSNINLPMVQRVHTFQQNHVGSWVPPCRVFGLVDCFWPMNLTNIWALSQLYQGGPGPQFATLLYEEYQKFFNFSCSSGFSNRFLTCKTREIKMDHLRKWFFDRLHRELDFARKFLTSKLMEAKTLWLKLYSLQ